MGYTGVWLQGRLVTKALGLNGVRLERGVVRRAFGYKGVWLKCRLAWKESGYTGFCWEVRLVIRLVGYEELGAWLQGIWFTAFE